MDIVFIMLLLVLTAWGTAAVIRLMWLRGQRLWVGFLALFTLGLVALMIWLSSIATGHYLSGLGEMLVALAIASGPGAGIILGVILAIWPWPGLVLSLLYVLGLVAAVISVM